VAIGPDWADTSWNRALDALASTPLAARLRSLKLDFDPRWREDDETIDHLRSRTWDAFAQLETLAIIGKVSGRIGALVLPALRALTISSTSLEIVDDIASSQLPRLESLRLDFGHAPRRTDQLRALDTIIGGKHLPKLVHLALCQRLGLDTIVERIAKSRMLPRLRTLDLSGGCMTATGARVLVENAEKFGHLESIDLERNSIPAKSVTALKKKLPRVNAANQGTTRDRDHEDRYDESFE
jgi:hypothetical protein